MSSLPLDCKHCQMMSGVASYYRPCTEHTIKCYWAWHACIALRQQTRSDNVGRGMLQSPLDSMYTWTTLCMHAIIALGLYTWSDEVGRGITECPLGSTHGRTTSGMTFHYPLGRHTRSNDVGHDISSSPSGSTHCWMMSGVACHHCQLKTYTRSYYVGLRMP